MLLTRNLTFLLLLFITEVQIITHIQILGNVLHFKTMSFVRYRY
jgi:hypothetical protein